MFYFAVFVCEIGREELHSPGLEELFCRYTGIYTGHDGVIKTWISSYLQPATCTSVDR